MRITVDRRGRGSYYCWRREFGDPKSDRMKRMRAGQGEYTDRLHGGVMKDHVTSWSAALAISRQICVCPHQPAG